LDGSCASGAELWLIGRLAWLVVVKLKQPLPLAFQDEDIQASVIVVGLL